MDRYFSAAGRAQDHARPAHQRRVALPAAELAALDTLESALRASGALRAGASLPIWQDGPASHAEPLGAAVEDHTVVALSLRCCGLRALPESLGRLTQFRFLDLRGNRLVALPASIGDLPDLGKVDARWNKLAAVPEWAQRLEQRGCVVFL